MARPHQPNKSFVQRRLCTVNLVKLDVHYNQNHFTELWNRTAVKLLNSADFQTYTTFSGFCLCPVPPLQKKLELN
jgi:hypothetical protein